MAAHFSTGSAASADPSHNRTIAPSDPRGAAAPRSWGGRTSRTCFFSSPVPLPKTGVSSVPQQSLLHTRLLASNKWNQEWLTFLHGRRWKCKPGIQALSSLTQHLGSTPGTHLYFSAQNKALPYTLRPHSRRSVFTREAESSRQQTFFKWQLSSWLLWLHLGRNCFPLYNFPS